MDVDPPTWNQRIRLPGSNQNQSYSEADFQGLVNDISIDAIKHGRCILTFETETGPQRFGEQWLRFKNAECFWRRGEANARLNSYMNNEKPATLEEALANTSDVAICGCYLDYCVLRISRELREADKVVHLLLRLTRMTESTDQEEKILAIYKELGVDIVGT